MKRTLFALSSWLLAPAAFAILDTNNNGVSDLWEREFNAGELFLQNFDAQADYDSDGWTNAQEAAAGSNPFDPNPPDGLILPITNHVPAVIEEENGVPVVDIPEAIIVTWPTLAGKQYTMYFSPDLTQGSWLPVGSPFIAQGGVSEYGFQELSVADKRFWRVAVEDVDEDNDGLTNHEEFLSGTNPKIADTDGDTLSDHAEIIAGTDPNHADADYDGMEDRWETAHGLDPTDWYDAYDDPDGDGIQNQFEYVLGFHPTTADPAEPTADRDNDGMPDYWEAQTGSFQWSYATQQYEFQRMLDWENPADAAQDPDSDDLTNLAEYQNTTNPFDWDTDYDYLPDGWEIQHGLVAAYQIQDNATWIYGSNGINGSTGDPDSDGVQNQFEYVLGFHPMVADPTGQTADRDNDGMPDFWEAQSGSFQWSSQSVRYEFVRTLDWDNSADASQDADGDGLAYLPEYQNTTDPLDWDTDYDYLPDGWEIQHGLIAAYRIQVSGSWVYGSSGTNGRTGDPDSDGIQNQYEYVLGFHPTTADPAEPTADRDNDGMPDLWEAQTGSFKWSSQNQRYEFQRNFDWENSADASVDPDSDGLPNLAEYQNATNPFDYDTDGDNLSDGWEIQYGFNPKSTASPNSATDDPDADGIENQYEQALGFHPTNVNAAELTADRDNDGMPDAWEAATAAGRHTSPETGTGITRLIRALDWEIDDSAEDYDSDGLANLLEYQAGLGVADPDSDDDLLPDGWEILYGFDPFVPSSDSLTADPDGDGYSNFLEAIMGTDPDENTSHPPTPPGNNIPGTPYPVSGTYPPTPPTPPSPNTGTAQWSFEAFTSSKTLPKYGYAEFSPTVPPKRYLKLLESVSFGLHGECDPPESRIDGTRLTTVNPLDNTRQVDDRQHPGNNNMGGTTTAQSPVVAVGISQVTSYDDDPNSESDCDATKTYTLHLSQENTTEQLIANTRAQLPAYQSSYSTWQTPHAYRNLDDDELGLAYQKCRYRIKWQSGTAEEERHRLTWLVVFQPETPAGQTEAPAPEILRSHAWDGASETSPEYEIDPENEKPGEDGSYYLVTVDVAVDTNKDGEITFDKRDQTESSKPFRFWINNDQDNVEVDEPVTVTKEDSADTSISTKRDLEDFCRLSLRAGIDLSVLQAGDLKIGLLFSSSNLGSPSIRCWPNQSQEGDRSYVEDGTTAAAQIAKTVFPTQGDTILIPASYWDERGSAEAHLIFEGVSKGEGKLVVTIHDRQGTKIGEGGELYLKLLDVREMFQRARIENSAEQIPDPWVDDTPPAQTWAWDPWNWPYDEDPDAENVTAIFVHGWRLTYDDYLNWAQTSYKRLWHQGFKGKFYSFRWATHAPSVFTYNGSEYRAWLCGPALASWVNQLPNPGRRSLFAHSMGNVISGAALRAGMSVQRYALCNAAMAAMAYDPNPALRNVPDTNNPLERIWVALEPHETPDTDPSPAIRQAFGLENKFYEGANLPVMFSFALPDDSSLDLWVLNNQASKPDGSGHSYYYQETPIAPNISYKLFQAPPNTNPRVVVSQAEALGYVTKSLTRPAGADLRTAGAISGTQNMQSWGTTANHSGFGSEHSAQWKWANHSTHIFWSQITQELQLKE